MTVSEERLRELRKEAPPTIAGQISYLERERQYHQAANRLGETMMVEAILSTLRKFAEVERDAKRYRWLRDKAEGYTSEYDHVSFCWRVGPRNIYVPPSNDAVDAAIDSAMPGEGK